MCSIKQDTNITLHLRRGGAGAIVKWVPSVWVMVSGVGVLCTVYCVLCTQGMTKHSPVVPIITPAHNAAATSSQAPGSSAGWCMRRRRRAHYNTVFVRFEFVVSWISERTRYVCSINSSLTDNLYEFLQLWFKLFPEYKKNLFFAFGQSFGGQFVASIIRKIHDENEAESAEFKWDLFLLVRFWWKLQLQDKHWRPGYREWLHLSAWSSGVNRHAAKRRYHGYEAEGLLQSQSDSN